MLRVTKYYGDSSETFKVDNVTITADTGSASGFTNEACVTSAEGASDCDTSTVVVDSPSGGHDKWVKAVHSGKCMSVWISA